MKKTKEQRIYIKRVQIEAKKHNKTLRKHLTQIQREARLSEVGPQVLSKGHLAPHHVESHASQLTPEAILLERDTRWKAIQEDIEVRSKLYVQQGKRGVVKTPVTYVPGTENNFAPKSLRNGLAHMKTGAPTPRLMYSSSMRNTPTNKRGKQIRPKEIYLKPIQKIKEGETVNTYQRNRFNGRDTGIGAVRRAVALPSL